MSAPRASRLGRLSPWLSFAACIAAVFWVANGVGRWDGNRTNVWHHYEYLTEGFLAGHTSLSVDPPQALLKLKDPYDPAANADLRLWDASLYNGKYYLYYGPAPAAVLMVPWRVLTGRMLPQRMAVALFAAAGFAGLALLLAGVRRTCFPALSHGGMAFVVLAAFHAAWLPVILRRPGVWELPIVSAAACLWWALYFLWRFRESGGRVGWAAAAGAALAVMIGCRVTDVFEAAVVLVLLLLPFEAAGAARVRRLKAALVAASIVGLGGVALLLYNHLRFGRWLEFGQDYMLGGSDIRGAAFLNPAFIPFNMRSYLLSLPGFSPYFPFLHPTWPDSFPAGYQGYEAIYGALFSIPVQLAGFVGLAWALKNRAVAAARGAAVTVAAAALSTTLAGAILFCWQGACSRYISELFAGWTVVAAVGLMAIFGRAAPGIHWRAARILAAAAACWTIVCVWLASADLRGFMRQTNPGTYRALAHALDYPSEWWIEARGIRFGPVDVVVRVPASPPLGETVLAASGVPLSVNQLVLDQTDANHARVILKGNGYVVLQTRVLPVPAGSFHIGLNVPWLYPPPEHPYWDRFPDAARRLDLQTFFSVDWGGRLVSGHAPRFYDASGLRPVVQGAQGADPRAPFVESVTLVPQNP